MKKGRECIGPPPCMNPINGDCIAYIDDDGDLVFPDGPILRYGVERHLLPLLRDYLQRHVKA